MTVQTPRCVVCRTSAILDVPEDGYALWRSGSYVQTAFPHLTDDERELLISGTHAHCWLRMFGDEDDA